MSTKSLVHRLIFDALLEMRERGRETNDAVVFHLADLFHNVALQLDKAETSDDFDEVLEFLRTRAAETGCDAWLETKLNNLEKTAAGRS
jgi:hypothetical protein